MEKLSELREMGDYLMNAERKSEKLAKVGGMKISDLKLLSRRNLNATVIPKIYVNANYITF